MSPPAADGLGGCTPAQIGMGSDAQNTCPLDSKIGTVEVESPLLPEGEHDEEGTLTGSAYLGKPESGPNTGPPYPLYLDVEGHGLNIKLEGKVEPNPQTGQITTTFADNPELPFDHLHLQLKGGPRSPLVNAPSCGRQVTTTELTPYSAPGEPARPTATFTTSYDGSGAACPSSRPFGPHVSAGTESAVAGQTSPFLLRLTRPEGDQPLSQINVTTPPGLTAYLNGVPYCPQAAIEAAEHESGTQEAASASCPAASQVGTVTTAAGEGPNPYYVQGKAYLAGPYKGAPLSMVFVTPALAGPFDLGTVVVRAALYVNPETAQITVKSDPLPQILGGVPLDLRSVSVVIDRPHFTLNPTDCEPVSVGSEALSLFAMPSLSSIHFQVSGCDGLPFEPQLKISLKGATRRIGHPALTAVLTAKPGEAGIARAQVNLPHGEFLDQGNLNKTCTRPVLLEGKCPASSVYGHAKAWTPLLEKPLEGPVYLVGGYGYKLPALVAELNGEIRILLVGKVDSGKNKGIRNTFEVVPDAPVEKFELTMKGGSKYSLLENSEDLCKASKKAREAIVRLTGQNGKIDAFKSVVQNQCDKGGKAKKKSKKSSAHSRASSRVDGLVQRVRVGW